LTAEGILRNSITGRICAYLHTAFGNSVTGRIMGGLDVAIGASPDSSAFMRLVRGDWHEEDSLRASLAGRAVAVLVAIKLSLLGRLTALVRVAYDNSVLVGCARRFVAWVSAIARYSAISQLFLNATELSISGTPSFGGFMLGVYVFLLPFLPTSLNTVLAFGLLLLWTFDRALQGDFRTGFARTYLPLSLLLLTAAGATIGSTTVRGSLPSLLLWVSYGIVFFLCSQWQKKRSDLWFIAACWVISSFGVSLVGLLQYVSGVQTPSAWIDPRQAELIKARIYSVFDNTNMLAEYLSYALSILLGMLLAARTGLSKMALALAGGVIGLAMLLTFSRGGWVATLVSVMIIGMLKDRRIVALVLLIAVISPVFLPQAILMRATTIVTLEDTSATYRLTIWKAALRMINDVGAFGAGIGPIAFTKIYPQYEIAGTPAAHTHNLYLQFIVEMGFLGLLFFLWTVVNHFRDAMSARGLDSRESIVMVAVVAGTVGQLVHGMIDNIWYSPKNVMFFWVALGLVVGMSLWNRRQPVDAR
jgi:putative inorganic carbon (hco3(-)) transporter